MSREEVGPNVSARESEHTMGMRWSGMITTLSRTLVLALFVSPSRHVGERWIQMRSRRERALAKKAAEPLDLFTDGFYTLQYQ